MLSVYVCARACARLTEGGSDKRRHGSDTATGRSADGFHSGSGRGPYF